MLTAYIRETQYIVVKDLNSFFFIFSINTINLLRSVLHNKRNLDWTIVYHFNMYYGCMD